MKGVQRIVTVEGLNLERFIRLAGDKGVICRKTSRRGRKYTALVAEDQIPILAGIAQQGGWQFAIGSRHGLGRYMNGAQRHWLLAGLSGAFLLGLFVVSRFMWSITLIDAGSYHADAQMYLQEIGMQTPILKSKVNLSELRDFLEWRYPDVAWIDCGWRGTELRITFMHGVPADDRANTVEARDVIATRSGIVESVVTLAGTPVVSPGDIISAGQVLIQGYERSADEAQTPVSARGIVKARVWDSASAKVSLWENGTSYTGRKEETWWIKSSMFNLCDPDISSFEHFDTTRRSIPLGGVYFPFVLCIDEYHEFTIDSTLRPLEQAELEAGEAALRFLRQKIDFHDDFVDKWIDYCMIEDEEVCAIAYGERIVDVASYE